jgi:hypothetical protein
LSGKNCSGPRNARSGQKRSEGHLPPPCPAQPLTESVTMKCSATRSGGKVSNVNQRIKYIMDIYAKLCYSIPKLCNHFIFGITIMYYGVNKYRGVTYNRIIFCITKTIKPKIPRIKHRE